MWWMDYIFFLYVKQRGWTDILCIKNIEEEISLSYKDTFLGNCTKMEKDLCRERNFWSLEAEAGRLCTLSSHCTLPPACDTPNTLLYFLVSQRSQMLFHTIVPCAGMSHVSTPHFSLINLSLTVTSSHRSFWTPLSKDLTVKTIPQHFVIFLHNNKFRHICISYTLIQLTYTSHMYVHTHLYKTTWCNLCHHLFNVCFTSRRWTLQKVPCLFCAFLCSIIYSTWNIVGVQ